MAEDEYAQARELYRSSRRDYAVEQPRFASDPDLGRMFETPTVDELAKNPATT